ncbi:glycosyltransferase family 4 protein, partial [Nitratidesulfovibrio liaohensis]|uniref:glycosyltransferase family 4 protein n=1 Tax=Nitratidesulfovibrio liaohensis TaxID=2604158 RepID=UPI0014214738
REARGHARVVLHTHDARAASLGALCKGTWGAKVPLLHTRRVSYPLGRGLSRRKYLAADAVAAVSAETGGVLAAAGLDPARITVIHSGIDPSRYYPRRERGDGRFVFGMVGALTPQKGHAVLIEALAALKAGSVRSEGDTEASDVAVDTAGGDSMPPWEVRVVGEGPLFGILLDRADALGVSPHMAFLGRQDSRRMLPDCDALVVPSVHGEGSSGVIKEGWVTGLPVICSGLASNLELVRDGENGLVVPPGDAPALGEAMRRIATDAALRARLVAGGTASVAHYTDTRMAESYMALYRRLR